MDKFGEVSVPVQALLESVLRNYSINAEDLYFKWESWGFKMGNNPPLNIENATLFKQDIQNQLEYSNQAKLKSLASTPASSKKVSSNVAAGYENFLDGDITPLSKKIKREPASLSRSNGHHQTPSKMSTNGTQTHYETPVKQYTASQPRLDVKTPFGNRKDAGAVLQTLNPSELTLPLSTSEQQPMLTVNFDPKKYSYRPMYQKLSEVSEILDDQIDQYAEYVLEAFSLKDEDIGNPSQNSQTETVVVGRIVCDSLDGGKLNAASVMLETSRRLGSGSRTKLDLSELPSFSLFPGQLIALKGARGAAEFRVTEILKLPSLPLSASTQTDFRQSGTHVVVAAGPYTPETDLSFDALKALRDSVMESKPDTVILVGPFLDLSHPMIKSGDLECLSDTLDGLFQELILPLIKDLPGLLIIPHTSDAISRHPCYPQEAYSRSITGLPKSTKLLPNPALFSLDEVSYGVSSLDILKHLTMSEISRQPVEKNALARQSSHILQQRRFYPLYPGHTGTNLDMGFAGLTEFGARLPDILITPSEMTTFIKVVDGVIVINPGNLSKKVGAGSFARIYIQEKNGSKDERIKEEEQDGLILNRVWERVKIDIVKI